MEDYTNEKTLLSIYISENDRYGERPLSEALLELFKNEGYPGATLLNCIAGFWVNGGIKGACPGDNKQLPVIVELIAGRGRINLIMPRITRMMESGMITMGTVKIARKLKIANCALMPEESTMQVH